MNNSAWELEERHTILELWTNALTKSPETIFVHFLEGDKKYTYAQFDQLTNQLAHGLLAVGVAQGDRIATLLDNHVDSVALFIAASKVNAIYVPVNTANKGEFLRNPLANSGSKFLVAEDKYLARVDAIRAELPELVACFVGAAPF